jgi:Ca2+-binding EF-hand superfamily protein
MPGLRLDPEAIARQVGRGNIPPLQPLTSVDLMHMPLEQLQRELDATEELLELNMQRQNRLVNGRWRQCKMRKQLSKEMTKPLQERSRPGQLPPPRWPKLGPSSKSLNKPALGGAQSSTMMKSTSAPLLSDSVPASAVETEELFNWMLAMDKPKRPRSALRQLLAPIPKVSNDRELSEGGDSDAGSDVDDGVKRMRTSLAAKVGAKIQSGSTQVDITGVVSSVETIDCETRLNSGDEIIIDGEYYRVQSLRSDGSIVLTSGVIKDVEPGAQIKKMEVSPIAIETDLESCKPKAFVEIVEHLDKAKIRAMTESICQAEGGISMPADYHLRQKSLLELYLRGFTYGRVSKSMYQGSRRELLKYGCYVYELRDVFRIGHHEPIIGPYEKGTVWRDCNFPDEDELDDYIKRLRKGQLMCWPSFTSTSTKAERTVTGNVTFQIECAQIEQPKKGYYPCLVTDSLYPGVAEEVLWPPHCHFRFVNLLYSEGLVDASIEAEGETSPQRKSRCIFEMETTEFPSIWKIIEKQDWDMFKTWSSKNPDKVDTRARKFSIITCVARHISRAPEAGAPDPIEICASCGADMNEVDPRSKDTALLIVAQKQAAFLNSGGEDLTDVLHSLVKHGGDVYSKNECGIAVVSLLPGFGIMASLDADEPPKSPGPSPKSTRHIRVNTDVEYVEDDAKTGYLKKMRQQRVSTWEGMKKRHTNTDLPDSPIAPSTMSMSSPTGTGEPPSLELDESLILSAFGRLSNQGELPTDQMIKLLSMAGHHMGNQTWIDEIMEEHYSGRHFIDEYELLDFTQTYQARFREYVETEFRKADQDDSGTVGAAEISRMLRMAGTTPTPGIVDELVWEITGVDNGLTELSLDEFIQLLASLQQRAGFSRSEIMQLQAIFQRYDRSGDGRISAKELSSALSWTGLAKDKTKDLVKQVEESESGDVDEREFYQIMRKHREGEIQMLWTAFADSDEDLSGSMDLEELPHVFERLGYIGASPKIIAECIEECGVKEIDKGGYVFEDVYLLLSEFRHREGFCNGEMVEIHDCFDKVVCEDGTIGAVQLENCIRWLGYPQSFEQLQEHLECFDISGSVDFQEYLKVVRQYKDEEILLARKLFFTKDLDKNGALSASELKMVLLNLGHTPTALQVKQLHKDICGEGEEMSLWQLQTLVESYRLEAREKFRKNKGFTDREVSKLQSKWKGHHPDKNGCLEKRQLGLLIAEVFPESARDAESHAKAAEILKEVDEDGNGKLEFYEFLQLMRLMQNQVDQRRLDKEKTAVEATGFQREEVVEFRKIFQMFDSDGSGEMSIDEFIQLIGSIVTVKGDAKVQELKNMITEVDDGGDRELDFPEFLRIMRKIQDEDWNNINETLAPSAENTASTAASPKNEAVAAGMSEETLHILKGCAKVLELESRAHLLGLEQSVIDDARFGSDEQESMRSLVIAQVDKCISSKPGSAAQRQFSRSLSGLVPSN